MLYLGNEELAPLGAEEKKVARSLSRPVSPASNGLFMWFDGIKNNKDGSHHKTKNGNWYPRVGGAGYYGGGTYSLIACDSYVKTGNGNAVWDGKGVTLDGDCAYTPKGSGGSNQCGIGRMEPEPVGVTFEAIFKPTKDTTEIGVANIMLCNQETGGATLATNPGEGKFYFSPYILKSDGTKGYQSFYLDTISEPNRTYYLIGKFDNATKTQYVRIICSELGIDEVKTRTLDGTLSQFDKAPIMIGGNPTSKGVISGSVFYGTIYSARVYNRCITQEEEENNIAFDKARYNF